MSKSRSPIFFVRMLQLRQPKAALNLRNPALVFCYARSPVKPNANATTNVDVLSSFSSPDAVEARILMIFSPSIIREAGLMVLIISSNGAPWRPSVVTNTFDSRVRSESGRLEGTK
jgi:hypothetical protein